MARVLVVDDERSFLEITREYLSLREGREVTLAASAEEARGYLEREEFDVVVSDYQMPGEDGISLLRSIRGGGSMVPFILFTGKGREEVVIEALNAGANLYLRKGGDPVVQFAELDHMIGQAVEARRRAERIEHLNLVLMALRKVNQLITKENDSQSLLRGVCETLIETRGYLSSWIGQFDPDGELREVARVGSPLGIREVLGEVDIHRICEELLDQGGVRAVRSQDITSPTGHVARAVLLVRCLGLNGRPFGALCVLIPEHLSTDQEELSLFEEMVEDISLALKALETDQTRRRGEKELVRLNRALRAIMAVHEAIIRTEDEEELFQAVCDIMVELGGHKMAWVGMAEEGGGRIVSPVAWAGEGTRYLDEVSVSWGHDRSATGPTGTAIRTGRIMVSHDIANDPIFEPWQERAIAYGFASCIAIPFTLRDGSRGAVKIYDREVNRFDREEIRLLSMLVDDITLAVSSIRGRWDKERAEQSFRSVFNSAGDAIFIHDTEGRLLEINDAAYRRLGYSRDEMLEMTLGDIDTDGQPMSVPDRIGPLKRDGHLFFESVHRARDGGLIPVEISSRMIEFYGEPAILSIARDISDRKVKEEELQLLNKRLNLLSMITRHDMLNQLSLMGGYLGLARKQDDRDKINVALDRLEDATERLESQLEFLREYYLMGSRGMVWLNVSQILRRESRDIPLEGVSLRLDIGSLMILADPIVNKVFYNLLDNSVRHGKRVSEISLTYRLQGKKAVISYRDNGVGIPEGMKGEIFKYRGAGRGLFLVGEILGSLGMSIVETGREGEGVHFEITVPEGRYDSGA